MAKFIRLPRNIVVGKNVLGSVSSFISEDQSVVVVTGPKTCDIAGNKIASILDCETFIVEQSDEKEAEKLKEYLKDNAIEVPIAVGGGKVIDVTKVAAFQTGREYISIPTNCSNDGLASPIASLEKMGRRESIKAIPPAGIVADLEIIANAPYRFIAAGVGDTVAKYSAVRDWKLGSIVNGEYYGDYSSALSLMVADVVINSAHEIKTRSDIGMDVLVEALISSGAAMGITGSSRPASGSEHKFSHALDKLNGTSENHALHGEQCGVGTIVMTYLQGEDWRRIKNALESADCPTTAKSLRIDEDMAIEAMLKAREVRPERYTILEQIKLDKESARNALHATEVI